MSLEEFGYYVMYFFFSMGGTFLLFEMYDQAQEERMEEEGVEIEVQEE